MAKKQSDNSLKENKQPNPPKKTIAIEATKTLPQGVVDAAMYRQYVELSNDPILNAERVYIASNDEEIDLLMAGKHLQNKIAELPEDEQILILSMSSERRSKLSQMHIYKRKAFNIRFGNISKEEREKRRLDEKDHILNVKHAELLELFGKFNSVNEVHKIVLDWGYDVSITAVLSFRERNLIQIKELQEKFKKDFSDLKLGHKRSRLDELHYLYVKRKELYEEKYSREDYKLLLTTLEQIRKEVEGDKLAIDITGQVDVNVEHIINLHIQNEILKELSILDIVISRICAKRGVNPRLIIAKLHNSYYKDFNGFSENIDFNSTPLYPSDEGFDMEKIQRIYLEKPKNQVVDQTSRLDNEQITPQLKEQVKVARESLVEIINRKKLELEKAKVKVNEYTNYEEVKTYEPKKAKVKVNEYTNYEEVKTYEPKKGHKKSEIK